METKDKIRRLLEILEHPENGNEATMKRMMEDEEMRELAEQLTAVKRAFVKKSIADDDSLVDEEWAKFEQAHFGKRQHFPILKAAAVFMGVLAVSGITIAAVYTMRGERPQTVHEQAETVVNANRQTAVSVDTTEVTSEPVVFDNVTLDKMMSEIAAYYAVKVHFNNDDVRQLRFHFVWRKELGVEKVVEDMNHFERVNMTYKDNKLTVE